MLFRSVNAAKCSDETVEDMFEEGVLENLSKEISAAREAGACRDMGDTIADGMAQEEM